MSVAARRFGRHTATLESPASGGFAITKDDANELESEIRGLYVGGAGDVAVVTVDGSEFTMVGLLAGQIYAVRLKQVKSTGTTATNLVGLY